MNKINNGRNQNSVNNAQASLHPLIQLTLTVAILRSMAWVAMRVPALVPTPIPGVEYQPLYSFCQPVLVITPRVKLCDFFHFRPRIAHRHAPPRHLKHLDVVLA